MKAQPATSWPAGFNPGHNLSHEFSTSFLSRFLVFLLSDSGINSADFISLIIAVISFYSSPRNKKVCGSYPI